MKESTEDKIKRLKDSGFIPRMIVYNTEKGVIIVKRYPRYKGRGIVQDTGTCTLMSFSDTDSIKSAVSSFCQKYKDFDGVYIKMYDRHSKESKLNDILSVLSYFIADLFIMYDVDYDYSTADSDIDTMIEGFLDLNPKAVQDVERRNKLMMTSTI